LLTLSGHIRQVNSVAWSPDGKQIATASDDKTAKVWDVKTRKALLTLSGHSDSLVSVAWSPNGKWLATGSADQAAKVWDSSSGKELLTLGGHTKSLTTVAWSPDGNRLATASADGIVQVYAMNIHDLIALARQRVTARPSEQSCRKYLHVDKCPLVQGLSSWYADAH
jgi:WD40 repeat protein